MIKHPLLQKEWKTTRWMMLLFSLLCVVYAIILNNNINLMKRRYLVANIIDISFMNEIYRMAYLMLPLMLIGVILLVILLFSQERNLNVGKFISTLPLGRKEQFRVKYVMGLITFTIPFILFGLVAIIIRVRNTKWISYVYNYSEYGEVLDKQNGLGALLLWLGIAWLIMMAVYSFLILIQTLMGQNIVAGVIGAIIYLVPWFLTFAIPANAELIFKNFRDFWRHRPWKYIPIGSSIDFFFRASPMQIFQSMEIRIQPPNGQWMHYRTYEYPHLVLNIAILIIVIVVSSILAYRFIQTNDVEKNGELIMYPWVGNILIVGVSICSLLLLPMIVAVFTGIQSTALTLILMAIGGAIGYVISKKSIEITQKHG